MKNDIFYLTFTSVCLYSTKTYFKGQGHLKVKSLNVKVKLKKINFLSTVEVFVIYVLRRGIPSTERHFCL